MVVFFPVTFLYGVSKFLFTALALAVVHLSVGLVFRGDDGHPAVLLAVSEARSASARGHEEMRKTNTKLSRRPRRPGGEVQRRLQPAVQQAAGLLRILGAAGVDAAGVDRRGLSGVFLASLAIYPFLGLAFFPQTDAGQFTINLKVPTGTRIEVTKQYVAKVEDLIRQVVDPEGSSRWWFPTLGWCRISPRCTPPMPGPTPPPFRWQLQ